MGTLDGQIAIVTGAGQGVGRGIALAIACEGAKVAVVGRTVSKCDAVVAEIEGRGGHAMAIECDVEDRDQIESSVERTVQQWGRLDLLVNNAHTKVFRSIRKLTDSDMATMWQSGPLATWRFMQASFPHLRESKGCVVNIGSGSGILPQAAMAGYAMTKESVRTLSRVGAVEWGRFGIRVNSICPLAESPGALRTRYIRRFDESLVASGFEPSRPTIVIGKTSSTTSTRTRPSRPSSRSPRCSRRGGQLVADYVEMSWFKGAAFERATASISRTLRDGGEPLRGGLADVRGTLARHGLDIVDDVATEDLRPRYGLSPLERHYPTRMLTATRSASPPEA